MKNSYKYIVALVALLSGFAVYAQNLSDGTYLESNGIAYAKRAIINDDGTYTIDLETFVTGEVTQTFESVPVDVVLVLDVSGSMEEAISSVSSYEPASVNSLTYNNNSGQTNYYYSYNGNYYRVTVGRQWDSSGWFGGSYHYHLSFQAGGRTYYINTSGQVVTTRPTNVDNADADLLASNVQLYEVVTTTTTKMDALKGAVKAFIDQIAHNDLYEDDTDDNPRDHALGNQISIVKFAEPTYYSSSTTWVNGNSTTPTIQPGNHFPEYRESGGNYQYRNFSTNYYESSSYDRYNATEVIQGFTLTGTEQSVADLKSAVSGLIEAGSTAADYGMNLARLLINDLGDDRANSNKVVVFFTDGAPTHASSFSQTVANAAIQHANTIKAITYGSGENATHPTIYSVGVFSGTVTNQIRNFMTSVASGSDHFFDASGGTAEDLKDIFTSIAHSAGGSGNTDVAGTSTLTVDVVSSSFSVPTEFNQASDVIEVLVAPCTGVTNIGGTDYLTFGAEKAPGLYGLPAITPDIDVDENKVSTTGFDYSANWCGPDPTSTTGYHGYKQIIRFTITVNDDAVGGPAVETNDSESGIYLEGSTEPLLTFNRPTVKLPVQIWIQKQGLRPGDSAVLTLSKAPFAENFNPATATWTNFTKVVVSYDDMEVDDEGNPTGLVKIVGLDPDYYYRLKEDAWAFGYTYQYGGIQYTVGDNVQNPFIFVNEPKPVKYDEASLRNVFAEKTAASGGSEGGESGESGEGN